MKEPELPADEAQRLYALLALQVLDTAEEERFDRLTRLAKDFFDVDIVRVSLVDESRQWFKSRQGHEARQSARKYSFCGHAIHSDNTLEIPDTWLDPRFHDNPFVTGAPGIRFYAGAPLHSASGHRVGTLCLIDSRPRQLDELQHQRLRDFADIVESELNRQSEHRLLDKIQHNERRLASIIDGTNVGTWEWNVQTGEVVFNERWAEMVGYTLDELDPVNIDTWLTLAHPEDLKLSEASLARHFSGASDFYDVECRMRHRQGQWIWVHDRGRIVSRDNRGDPLWMAGTHSDITTNRVLRNQLDDQKSFLENIFNSSVVAITVLSDQGALIYANDLAQTVLGLEAQSSESGTIHYNDPGWRIETLDGSPMANEALPFARTKSSGHAVFDVRHAIVWPSGQRRYLSISGAPLDTDGDGFQRYVFALNDITAEVNNQFSLNRQLKAFKVLNSIAADEALSHSQRMERALNLGADFLGLELGMISRIDAENYQVQHSVSPEGTDRVKGRVFRTGHTYCQLTLESDDVVAIHHMAESEYAGHPCYAEFGLESYIGFRITTAGSVSGTLNFSSSRPREKPFSESEQLFVRLLGRWVGAAIDRHRALTQLRLSESRFRALFELSPIGIALNDFETGRFMDANDALLQSTGYNRETFLSLDYSDITPVEYFDEEHRMRDVLVEQGRYGPFEKEYINSNGLRFPVLVNGVLAEDTRGRQLIWSIIEDISERKRIDRMKDEFISTVSHELRTPLTSITGSLRLLSAGVAGEMPDEAARMLEIAYNNGQRLSYLINDLLDMEKLVSGKLSVDSVTQPINPLVEAALRDNQSYAQDHNVRYRFIDAGTAPLVNVDGNRLQQVLANLLSNAAKFSPPDSEVTVAVTTDGSGVTVSVRDHGPGIPESFKPRLFRKFSQVDGSDRRSRYGTGLGLAISKALIDQMGGTIGVESEEGKGSTFYFSLPETKEEPEPTPPPEAP